MLKVSDNGNVLVNQYIYPADGTTNSSFRLSNGNGTQMAYAQGIVIVNPNFRYFTSYLNKIAFEVAATTGDVSINGATGAKVGIKGNGATSATTALLVQNSAGTEHFKTTDDGVTTITSASQSVPLYVHASGSGTGGIEISSTSARRFRILATSVITTLEATNTGGITTNSSLNVGGSAAANASAVLQADSTTQGFLPPRMTTAERDLITTPAAGLMVYNTTTSKAQCYNGTTWNDLF
jgi:hypothetical protein